MGELNWQSAPSWPPASTDTQLNLGHLIHQADNHRGSFRGLGFELRTSAYGAIRGGQGVLLSSYGTQPGEPAGDNAPGIALQGQLVQLIDAFRPSRSPPCSPPLRSPWPRCCCRPAPAHPGPAPPEPLRPWACPGAPRGTQWDRMERTLWHALHGPWRGEAIVAADKELHCVIRQTSVPHNVHAPFAFTRQCRWPQVLGGDLDPAARTRV